MCSSKGGSRVGVGWAILTATRSCSLCSHLPLEGSETDTSLLAHLCRPRSSCVLSPVSKTCVIHREQCLFMGVRLHGSRGHGLPPGRGT